MSTSKLAHSNDPGCASFDALIAKLGTHALVGEDEIRVRTHLATCARCSELAQLFDEQSESDEALDPAPSAARELPRAAGATIAGRYRLDHVLGRGGMGVVWAATQSRTGQEVAVKLLDDKRADARARRRFLREARSSCAVRHPNVVRVYDVVELSDGAPAIVMERLHGHSLQRRIDRGPMPLGEICHVLARVAAAASAAHGAGIVHRDLKPENVFLSRSAEGIEVKVLDFGVAKRTGPASETSGTLTRTGALVGTPYYMAPEQALGEDDVDARADIWALGIMLYQGLSGVLPTRAENLGRVFKAVAMTPIQPIDRLVPDLPPDLVAMLARMLSKARDGRPGRMDDVHAVLAKHASASLDARADLDAKAAPDDVTQEADARDEVIRGADAPDTAPLPRTIAMPERPPSRRTRTSIAALATTIVIGTMGLVATIAGRPRAGGAIGPAALPTNEIVPTASVIEPELVAPREPTTASPTASASPPRASMSASLRPPRNAPSKPTVAPAATSAATAPSSIGVERGF